MAGDIPDLATSQQLRFTDGRQRRSRWGQAVAIMVCVGAVVLLFDGQTVRSDDPQTRACLEPVYAGLFGTGSRALQRCLQTRPKLFGVQDAQWLRYVRHLEISCPSSIGMQGQAICEFQVKSSEDHAGKGWRTQNY